MPFRLKLIISFLLQTTDSDVPQEKTRYKRVQPLVETTESEKPDPESEKDTLTTESDSGSIMFPATGFYKPVKRVKEEERK